MIEQKPWQIRYKNVFLLLCILPWLTIPIFFYLNASAFLFFAIFLPFLIMAVSLNIYRIGKRFAEVVDALENELTDVKISSFFNPVLECTSLRYGRFFLLYFPGNKHSSHRSKHRPAYYKLWISTQKNIGNVSQVLQYISPDTTKEIKSLRSVNAEIINGEHCLVATFNDKLFYSETPDIIQTLDIMKEIKRKL